MKKEYEIEATVVHCSSVVASNAKEARELAIEDMHEDMWETQVFPEDCKIISTRKM